MLPLVVNGQPESNYVRTVRMACIEAGVDHELRPLAEGSVDAVLTTLRSEAYRKKHPFARMPSLEDGDVVLFETSAICRYVTQKYGGSRLIPGDFREAVRMEQWISAVNAYVIPDSVSRFVAPLVFQPAPDLDAIERDKPLLRSHYEILDRALEGRAVLAGENLSVADLLLAPILDAVGSLPGGAVLFDGLGNLGRWWEHVTARGSFTETRAPLTVASARAA